MKKLLLIMSIILTSCVSHPQSSNQRTPSENPGYQTSQTIKVLEQGRIGGNVYFVVYDTHTKVMYIFNHVYGGLTITPLLDQDGTPRLYGDPS